MSEKYEKLPFLLGLAHGGTEVPEPLGERLRRDSRALAWHADPGLEELLDFEVIARLDCQLHRYACDVAIDPAARGAVGVVPTRDLDDFPLYDEGDGPTEEEVTALVTQYHATYHKALQKARKNEDLAFHFQVQAFESNPPPTAPDKIRLEENPKYVRPDVILGNHGGADGAPVADTYTSCPRELLFRLKSLFEEAEFTVGVNDPEPGGYDVQLHGKRWYAGIGPPVALLGLNQDMWLNAPRGTYDPGKGDAVRERLVRVLERFADYLLQDEVSL